MRKCLLAVFLLPAAALADNQPIPTQLPVIEISLNGRPVEVRAEEVDRYRCRQGRLVATSEGSAGRTNTRKLTLRCI